MNNLAPMKIALGVQSRSKKAPKLSLFQWKKTYEKVSITVTAVFENMLPDDISTPYRET